MPFGSFAGSSSFQSMLDLKQCSNVIKLLKVKVRSGVLVAILVAKIIRYIRSLIVNVDSVLLEFLKVKCALLSFAVENKVLDD